MHDLDELTEINLDDLVSSFGWQDWPMPARLLRILFRPPAKKFAQLMLDFDKVTGDISLTEGARHTLRKFIHSIKIVGQEKIPVTGPLLFLSNHPGMVDTLALFDAIDRADLRIIALNRPFLRSLPNTSRHLFFISDDQLDRMRAVRQASNHLRLGGALLTFPAGKIEPDPAVYPGAEHSLENWTDSAGIFMRFVPGLQIVPVLVSGVLWDRAVNFPMVKLKKAGFDREKLGAALQLLAHIVFDSRPLNIKIQFAPPITLAELGSQDPALIHITLIARMRTLVSNLS